MILAILAVAILGVTISNEVTDEKHDLFVSDIYRYTEQQE